MGISRAQALDCFASDDLIGIGMEADSVRRALHPDGVVSYGIARPIPCGGRAFEAISREIDEAVDFGATGVILNNTAAMDLDQLVALLAAIKRNFPELCVQGLATRELAGLGVEAIATLRHAGLDSIGCGPEFVDEDWVRVHRAAHRAGMRTAAEILVGAGETFEQRLTRLDLTRGLQEETGGFAALATVPFHAPGGRELDETTAVEYLKTLAVARMYLDNIENVQSDWTTQGLKVLQMALRFGANDLGSVGVGASEEELRRLIRDAGFRPAQRDMGFRAMMLT